MLPVHVVSIGSRRSIDRGPKSNIEKEESGDGESIGVALRERGKGRSGTWGGVSWDLGWEERDDERNEDVGTVQK